MKRHAQYLSAAAGLSIMLVAGLSLYSTHPVSSQTRQAAQGHYSSTSISYSSIPSGTSSIDPAHSSINFSIRQPPINNVGSRCGDIGAITYNGADGIKSSAEFTAKVGSIDTDIAKPDEHLRTADFVDDARYQEVPFKSTRIQPKRGDAFLAHGAFTLHGVSKQVAIPFRIFGAVKDPVGRQADGR